MVYVDDAAIMHRGKRRFHMTADSVQELHDFCAQVGIKRCWWHSGSKYPHYDITGPQREAVLLAGGTAVTCREFVVLAKKLT